MPLTVQQVMDRARVPLNDKKKGIPADGVRYPDADLLTYSIDCVLILFERRPDLFFGTFDTFDPSALAVGDPWPTDATLIPACADYITARAMFRDAEDAVKGKATTFYNLFEKGANG